MFAEPPAVLAALQFKLCVNTFAFPHGFFTINKHGV
jgi:hypothetical protein